MRDNKEKTVMRKKRNFYYAFVVPQSLINAGFVTVKSAELTSWFGLGMEPQLHLCS